VTPVAPAQAFWTAVAQYTVSAAIGVLIGAERTSARKAVGIRTFGGIAVVFTAAWLSSPRTAYALLLLLVPFVAALNVRSLFIDRSLELTTSAAMLSTALLGILVAQGQPFAAAVCGCVVTGLLAWKAGLGRFATAATVGEVRGALMVGLLAVVVYPLLPAGPLDPWGRVGLRAAWIAVLGASAIGLASHALLRRRRGVPRPS